MTCRASRRGGTTSDDSSRHRSLVCGGGGRGEAQVSRGPGREGGLVGGEAAHSEWEYSAHKRPGPPKSQPNKRF